MSRMVFVAIVAAILSTSATAHAQSAKKNKAPAAPLTPEEAQVRQVAANMGGGPNVWWVVNTQYSKVSGNILTKQRGHTVVHGTEAAARMIVDFMKGKDPRGTRVNWEAFPSEQAAEARAEYWNQYDFQAGYR